MEGKTLFRLATLFTICLALRGATVLSANEEAPDQFVHLSIVDVIETDSCMVKRVAVNVPPGSRVQLVNDSDQAQMNSSPVGKARPTVHLNVLADLLDVPGSKETTLKTIINLSGSTLTRTKNVVPGKSLGNILAFNVEPGKYAMNERIPILRQVSGRNYFVLVTMPRR